MDLLKEWEKILIAKYGEENVGIFKLNDLEYLGVYFKELDITNSVSLNVYITKGVYFLFNSNLHIYGYKDIFTEDEFSQRYIHSHCTIFMKESPSSFCTGTSPYQVHKTQLLNNIENINNVEDLQLYLRELLVDFDQMIRVESVQGGPFQRFSNITKKELRSVNTCYVTSFYYPTIRKRNIRTLESFVEEIIKNKDKYSDNIFYYLTTDEGLKIVSKNNTSIENEEIKHFCFKGETKNISIIKVENRNLQFIELPIDAEDFYREYYSNLLLDEIKRQNATKL